MAERGRFELPIALRLCLISSQVHSTGLCHLSVFSLLLFLVLTSCVFWFFCSGSSGARANLPQCTKLPRTSLVYRQKHRGCNAECACAASPSPATLLMSDPSCSGADPGRSAATQRAFSGCPSKARAAPGFRRWRRWPPRPIAATRQKRAHFSMKNRQNRGILPQKALFLGAYIYHNDNRVSRRRFCNVLIQKTLHTIPERGTLRKTGILDRGVG